MRHFCGGKPNNNKILKRVRVGDFPISCSRESIILQGIYPPVPRLGTHVQWQVERNIAFLGDIPMLGSFPRNPKVSRIWDSTHVTPRRFEFGSHGTRRGWTTQPPLDEPRIGSVSDLGLSLTAEGITLLSSHVLAVLRLQLHFYVSKMCGLRSSSFARASHLQNPQT